MADVEAVADAEEVERLAIQMWDVQAPDGPLGWADLPRGVRITWRRRARRSLEGDTADD